MIALEAKRPNYTDAVGTWDKNPRFTKQLKLHAGLNPAVVSGGFFIDARAPYTSPPWFDDLGGLFVSSQELLQYHATYIVPRPACLYWINKDVDNVVHMGKAVNLHKLVEEAVLCNLGSPLHGAAAYSDLVRDVRRLSRPDDVEVQTEPTDDEASPLGQLAEAFGARVAISFLGPWFLNDPARVAEDRERRSPSKTDFPSTHRRLRT